MASSSRPFTALVLAGRREAADPLAEATGAPHRALLDIEGTPMLARVLTTLSEYPRIGRILLSMDAPELLESIPSIASRLESGEVVLTPVAPSPSRSVVNALDEIGSDERLLVTTADHALLDGEMLDFFLDRAEESSADFALALVPATIIQARFPDVQRTYLRFRNERYSGANLFAFLTPKARAAAEFWQRAEAHRKTPWKLVRSFGFVTLLLFLARRLDLQAAFRRVSRAIGVEVQAIEMPMAEASVDVDKLSDLELARRILAER
jgi:2-C-methyl-D-erythritol 4-phosphate cytidylyltransferase